MNKIIGELKWSDIGLQLGTSSGISGSTHRRCIAEEVRLFEVSVAGRLNRLEGKKPLRESERARESGRARLRSVADRTPGLDDRPVGRPRASSGR